MRQFNLVLALAFTLSLAGCSGGADEAENDDDVLEGAAAPPTDVRISERVDLSTGVSAEEASWSVPIAADAKTATIRFSIEGKEGLAWQPRPACLAYEVEGASSKTGEEGGCSSGTNLIVSVTPPRLEESVLIDWQGEELTPGSYSFTFRADPQVADLVVEVQVLH